MGKFGKKFPDFGLLFVTTTVIQWKKIFHIPQYALIAMNSLKYCVENGWFKLYSYVLMPNHLHLILKVLKGHTVEQISRDFHKYTAQRILLAMRSEDPHILTQFWVGTEKQDYKVWQGDADLKNVVSSRFLLQKAEFIHNNPLRGNWRRFLKVESAEDCEYSSARFYLTGVPDKYVRVSDLRTLAV
jgi:REP element-mobilizing transposase RayT